MTTRGTEATARERRRPRRLAAAGAPGPAPRPRRRIVTGQARWWRDALRRRMLAVADVGAGLAGTLVAAGSLRTASWALAILPVWILFAKLAGLYDRDHQSVRHLTLDELPTIAAWAGGSLAVVALVVSATPADAIEVPAAARGWVAATAAALVLRGLARMLWRRTTPRERTIIVGGGELAIAMRRKIELFGDMHMDLVGEVGGVEGGDEAVRSTVSKAGGNGELHDTAAELIAELEPDLPDRLIIATPVIDPDLVARLAALCRERQMKLSVVSPLRGGYCPTPRLSRVADLPVLEYDTWDVPRSTLLLKRVMDLVVGSIGLLLLAPVFALAAIAIKLEDRGPVFFTQLRAGLGGAPFTVVKFRTMVPDAEARLAELVSIGDLREPMFKLRDDPRVTRVGRWLRRLSIDELPQLLNVIRGDMSLVGPRPEQLELARRYGPEHMFRLSLKPGVTGPMQVFGRGELTFSERLAVEHDYVENVSLTRDLRILVKTFPAVIRGTGAY